jgi:hypothetical protein
MHPFIDPTIREQVEAFQRQLQQSATYYQQAIAMLAADRIARDTQPVFVSPLARRHRLRRAGTTVLRWLFHRRIRNATPPMPITPDAATITIIDIDLPRDVQAAPPTATPRTLLTSRKEKNR